MDITLLYWILIAVMLVGVAGAVLPGVPGPSLILAAILVWCVVTKFSLMGWPLVLIFVALILSAGVEVVAAWWGASQVGASKWSQIGALLGIGLGFFGLLPALPIGGPLVGILFGAVLGAFLGEYFYRKELAFKERLQQSLKVSMAIAIGSVVGNVLEVLLAIAAVVIFVWSTWPPVGLG